MAGKRATMTAVLLVCMGAYECDGECTLSLLSTLIALLASGDGKCPPGVPPHDGLRTASDTASGRTDGAHQAPSVRPDLGGMDGLRHRRRGTACDPGKKRQVFPGIGPPTFGPPPAPAARTSLEIRPYI